MHCQTGSTRDNSFNYLENPLPQAGLCRSAAFVRDLASLSWILITRFVLGISVAALIGDYAQESKLAASMGRQSLLMAFGNVLFVSLSGVLADLYPFCVLSTRVGTPRHRCIPTRYNFYKYIYNFLF